MRHLLEFNQFEGRPPKVHKNIRDKEMKHIKDYKTFEGLIPKYNEKKWKDFLDVLRAEDVLTDFNISESELELDDNGLYIQITGEEKTRLREAIEATWERAKEYTGNYPHTNITHLRTDTSKIALMVTLESMPTITAIYGELGLETTKYKENGYTGDVTCGVLKSIDHAFEAFKYLNTKRRFAYDSDFEPLRELCEGLTKMHEKSKELVARNLRDKTSPKIKRLLLNVEKFTDENFRQYVAVIVELEGVTDNPIYVINSARTDSPYVFVRYGSTSWDHLNINKAIVHNYR